MKISLIFMCVLGFYFSNSTLIQYKSGTIIKQEKVINAGSNTMNLIIHIPQLKNQTDYFYFRPCKYMNYIQEDLFNAGIASNVSTIRYEFNYSYPTIKESNGLLLFSTMQVYELYTRRLIQCGNSIKCFNNTDSIYKSM